MGEHTAHRAAMSYWYVRTGVHRSPKLHAVELRRESQNETAATQWDTGTAVAINYQQQAKKSKRKPSR